MILKDMTRVFLLIFQNISDFFVIQHIQATAPESHKQTLFPRKLSFSLRIF